MAGDTSRQRFGNMGPNGGTMIFVKNTWRQRLRGKDSSSRSQMLAVQVADLLIMNTYTPPDVEGKAELAQMCNKHFIEEGWDVVK